MARNNDQKTYTDETGKFALGNPGRPKGARHKMTRIAEELFEDDAERLSRKAIELALEGDTTAMRLCLERIVPSKKDAPVQFDLPKMASAHDAAEGAQAVLQAVSEGELTPSEGASVMALIETYRRTLETTEFDARLKSLEGKLCD